MSPTTRARLCAALERETGRKHAPNGFVGGGMTVSECGGVARALTDATCREWRAIDDLVCFASQTGWPRLIRIVRGPDRICRLILSQTERRDLGPYTGRGWPERLAGEVARVLSETATTGGSDG